MNGASMELYTAEIDASGVRKARIAVHSTCGGQWTSRRGFRPLSAEGFRS